MIQVEESKDKMCIIFKSYPKNKSWQRESQNSNTELQTRPEKNNSLQDISI